VAHARNIAAAVNIPVICDADTGFGNPLNVMRTTREIIRGGLAGMYIEDQLEPKRCPGLGGGMIIPCDEMIRKLKSVFEVRQDEDPDFLVIARTHASRAIGIDEAVKRGIAYAKEGADAIFVDLGYSDEAIEEIRIVVDEVGPHAPIMITLAETVGRPLLSAKELEKMGVKIVLYAMTGMMTAAGALKSVFTELKEKGTTKAMVDRMMPFKELGRLMGMDTITEFERRLGIARPGSPAE
jgi:methylisocitrate lyase